MGGYAREARGEFKGTEGADGVGCSTVGLLFFPPCSFLKLTAIFLSGDCLLNSNKRQRRKAERRSGNIPLAYVYNGS
jgi:hypothetical protein